MSSPADEMSINLDLPENGFRKDNYFFIWTIDDIRGRVSNEKSQSLANIVFPARDNDNFKLWQIELNSCAEERNGNAIVISLSLPFSENNSQVHMKFCSVVLSKGTKKFIPRSINRNFKMGDKVTIPLIDKYSLESELNNSSEYSLRILCELLVTDFGYTEKTPEMIKNISDLNKNMIAIQSYANMPIYENCEIMLFHKTISIERHYILINWLKDIGNDMLSLHTGNFNRGFDALLQCIYSAIMDFYSRNVSVKCIDVTWTVPRFNNFLNKSYVGIYCPGSENNLFDNQWQFQLNFNSSQNHAGVYVHRRNGRNSINFVKFAVKLVTTDVTFEKCTFLHFKFDDTQGISKFIRKDLMRKLLSQGNLVLKCSLEILNTVNSSEIHCNAENCFLWKQNCHISVAKRKDVYSCSIRSTPTSIQNLSVIFKELIMTSRLQDAVIETKRQCYRIETFMLSVRSLAPLSDINSLLQNIDANLVSDFLHYFYAGNTLTYKNYEGGVITKQLFNSAMCNYKRILEMFLEFLSNTSLIDDYHSCVAEKRKVIRNDGISRYPSAIRNDSTSSDENENCVGSSFSDNAFEESDSSLEADNEVRLIYENPIALRTSDTYAGYHSLIPGDDRWYSISGRHCIMRPQCTRLAASDLYRSTRTDVSGNPDSPVNIYGLPRSLLLLEDDTVTNDILRRHSTPISFESRSTLLNTASGSFMPMIRYQVANPNTRLQRRYNIHPIYSFTTGHPSAQNLPRASHRGSTTFVPSSTYNCEINGGYQVISNQLINYPLQVNIRGMSFVNSFHSPNSYPHTHEAYCRGCHLINYNTRFRHRSRSNFSGMRDRGCQLTNYRTRSRNRSRSNFSRLRGRGFRASAYPVGSNATGYAQHPATSFAERHSTYANVRHSSASSSFQVTNAYYRMDRTCYVNNPVLVRGSVLQADTTQAIRFHAPPSGSMYLVYPVQDNGAISYWYYLINDNRSILFDSCRTTEYHRSDISFQQAITYSHPAFLPYNIPLNNNHSIWYPDTADVVGASYMPQPVTESAPSFLL